MICFYTFVFGRVNRCVYFCWHSNTLTVGSRGRAESRNVSSLEDTCSIEDYSEAEQKSEASVCHVNIKQMGHSTNLTTSEDHFECLNKTEPGTWVLPVFFIPLHSTSSKCFAHDKALLCLFDFFCSYSVIYNQKIKDHIWIVGEKLHTSWKNRAAFLCCSSVEAICTLSPISLPCKGGIWSLALLLKSEFSTPLLIHFSMLELCDHSFFWLLDIPCTVTL